MPETSQSAAGTLGGREVVLAGGSGGIGAAAAELLAAEGARLVVSYRTNAERAARLASIAAIVQADLTRAEDRRRLLDAAPDLYALVVFTGDPARRVSRSQPSLKTPCAARTR
jgi:NAD(P)-dependent dehydrogenase (short-subunit alcohol dehydrogenase family)